MTSIHHFLLKQLLLSLLANKQRDTVFFKTAPQVAAILDQIFWCDPVVLESICYCTRAKRLINDSKTTGELRKNWTGISHC